MLKSITVLIGLVLFLGVAGNGLFSIQFDPIILMTRNVLLAALGESTPGLKMQGDPRPQQYICDRETGLCTPKGQ
jgi:hypothetical protein